MSGQERAPTMVEVAFGHDALRFNGANSLASSSSFMPATVGAISTPMIGLRTSTPSAAVEQRVGVNRCPNEPTFQPLDTRRLMRGNTMSSGERELKDVKTVWIAVGAGVGIIVAIVLAQIDAGASSVTQWLVVLPGDLFANALLLIALPLLFCDTVGAGVHFAGLSKTRQVCLISLACFVGMTLYASVIGAVVAIVVAGLFPSSTELRTYLSAAANSTSTEPSIAFICPSINNTNADSLSRLVFQSSGSLACEAVDANATGSAFVLDDISHTFALANQTDVPSVTDQAIRVLDSIFPVNFGESFVSVDVLGVVVAGIALGAALTHSSRVKRGDRFDGPRESSLLYLLIVQAEITLSLLFRWMLQILPIGVGFMVCSGMLRSASDPVVAPSAETIIAFFGALMIGLIVFIISLVSVAAIKARSNPLRYLREMIPGLIVAFTSSSSLAALPSTLRSIETTREVSMPLARLVCSSGVVLNKSGSAIYLSIGTVFLLSTVGSGGSPSAGDVASMIAVSALCSVVVSPVPGGSTVVLATVLGSIFGVDSRVGAILIAYLAAMDWICDPLVTVVNTLGDMVLSFILAGRLNERYRDESFLTQDGGTSDGSSNAPQHRTLQELYAEERIMSLSLNDSQVAL